MKKIAPVVILFLCALLAWNVFIEPSGFSFDIDGEDIDGPLGALLGLLFAGGGVLIAALVILCVGALLAVIFAGLGVMLALGLGLLMLVLAALISPLMLPLLIPLAIVWFIVRRNRRKARVA